MFSSCLVVYRLFVVSNVCRMELGSLWQGSKARWLGELSDKCAAVIYHWDKEIYTVMLTVRLRVRLNHRRQTY